LISEQEQADFQDKAGKCRRMNLLREQSRDFTKDRFNPTAQPLFVIIQSRSISALRVSLRPTKDARHPFLSKRLPIRKGICGISRYLCATRQGERQFTQAFDVGSRTGQDATLDGNAFDRHHDLHSDSIK
jgi:hypothetical protein